MSLANDHMYGYVGKLLAEKHVTWLECAAASLVWSTILVYYLEAPYGHLMQEKMDGPEARTMARGNLFSFSLPWEEIEARCKEARGNWDRAVGCAEEVMPLPHDEHVLAALVNVHIVGGTTDLAEHLKGATMRCDVVLWLIAQLRTSGHPGYEAEINSEKEVQERVQRLYRAPYGEGRFVPKLVKKATEVAYRAKLSGTSLIQDKNATPSEPAQNIKDLEAGMRPLSLVANRNSAGVSTAHEEHGTILCQYQTLEFNTGSTMLNQYHPAYLGMAFPFTLPVAVGGYDVRGMDRWRRDGAAAGDFTACEVKLYDVTRSLPQRIEGQFRRHWAFLPALWNLYFREQLNTGVSLSTLSRGEAARPCDDREQDAALAAAQIYEALSSGTYKTQTGVRKKIDGDVSKLLYAENLNQTQRRLLQDFNFRTRSLPGTQGIRSKIYHICFWGQVVYGNGIFMTISPGERHNYLAIRLSRYRKRDPLIAYSDQPQEADWIGPDKPSLRAKAEDVFNVDIPGYDLRHCLLARDPLACVNAFMVQVRCMLPTLLGIRMCPLCPHCCTSLNPCSDAWGCNGELTGGCAGRGDALAGAVECQKKSGALHLHFWFFGERLHQYDTLEQIAEKLQDGLVNAEGLKRFLAEMCVESYPDLVKHKVDKAQVEAEWPKFHEEANVAPETSSIAWGNERIGRVPPFVWDDGERAIASHRLAATDRLDELKDRKKHAIAKDDLHEAQKLKREIVEAQQAATADVEQTESYADCLRSSASKSAETYRILENEAARYTTAFKSAQQHNQERVQHHIHKRSKDGTRIIPNACRSKRNPKLCKHEFPMTGRMNSGEPRLICPGLAKHWGLRQSGPRNMLGCYLGYRNSEWLDGTCPALCIGLTGGNTDVKVNNDRMPITAETHDAACNKNCLKTNTARKVQRRMMRAHASTNGYFGGYIAKRQPCGRFEAKKCIDKMNVLKTKTSEQSAGKKLRAASGRMVTDLEMNGTLRGAVEEFNLCRNLRPDDVIEGFARPNIAN